VDLASLLFVLWAVLRLFSLVDALPRNMVWLAWTLLLAAMLFRRGQDEFWHLCWRKASVAAFAGLLIVPPLLLVGLSAAGQKTTFDHDVLVILLFAIFFARFHWTRFRGARD
jgi:hypothetical protein